MARTWRESDTNRAPEQARLFLDAHHRLEAQAAEAGIGPADATIHHFGRGELRAIWESEGVVLVVEGIGEPCASVTYERLAYEPSQRALDKQERLRLGRPETRGGAAEQGK